MSKVGVRRTVFRTLWLLIGLVVAVSLFKLAFAGSKVEADERPLTPTGEVPIDEVVAETGAISNTLSIDGTIVIDKPVSATASASGVLVHVYAGTGQKVAKGDNLFQIRVEDEPAAEPELDPEPAGEGVEGEDGGVSGEPAKKAPAAKPVYRWFTVVAPASGTVGHYSVDLLQEVAEDAAVVSITRNTFHAVGAITPLDRYRLASNPTEATVEIRGGGPKPFTCTNLTVGESATETVAGPTGGGREGESMDGGGEGESGAGSKITCVVPKKVTVYDGLEMTLTINAGKTDGKVVVIPVTSVKGLFGEGTVWLLGDGGEPTEHAVNLGETDGKQVEVTSGLNEGDRVLRYVPGSEPQDDMGMYDDGMMYG
jgi:multidrug efflux pump subunit AcrA (membrane-fusion protein)